MELEAYEIMSRATGKPGTKARLARALGLPTNAISRRCCAPERIDNPCGTGRTNEVERLETILKGLVAIGRYEDAEFIVKRLQCFVVECQQANSDVKLDRLGNLTLALDYLVKALRTLIDGRPRDFEEQAMRASVQIERSVVSAGRE